MNIGVGLPAAVPDVDGATIGAWAALAEQAGFASVGVIDRLVYDNLEPLTALAAAAARTERLELLTTVLNVGWRANPVLLAKQMASVDLLSGGRLTAGLGLGGWPDDYAASGVPLAGGGPRMESAVEAMRRVWAGVLRGQAGPTRPLPAGRPGTPRIVTGRYFSLGSGADRVADDYIRHYYGDEYSPAARADTLTSAAQIQEELDRLADAGVTDVVLYPSSAGLDQVELVAEVVRSRS